MTWQLQADTGAQEKPSIVRAEPREQPESWRLSVGMGRGVRV